MDGLRRTEERLAQAAEPNLERVSVRVAPHPGEIAFDPSRNSAEWNDKVSLQVIPSVREEFSGHVT